jgi:hypothetical protein
LIQVFSKLRLAISTMLALANWPLVEGDSKEVLSFAGALLSTPIGGVL